VGPLVVDPPVLQAPMAGFSSYAFREIVRRLGGVGLAATEMVSARGFLEIEARGRNIPERLWGVKHEPRPLAVQIWDNDAIALAAAAVRLRDHYGVSVVDINFGCPVRVVAGKARSGSYLLRDPDQVGRIVARVVEACRPTPVTAKIRLGVTRQNINAVDVCRAIEAAGAAAVTVHGRTAADGFGGHADWERIAEIKPHLKRIPLIGNGDLTTPQAVQEAFRRYGVDGVMIGRAALSRPWLFGQVQAALAGRPIPADPPLSCQRQLLLDHYWLLVEQFGATKATMLVRKVACRYAQGKRGGRTFRSNVTKVATPQELTAVVEEYFPRNEADDRSSGTA